MTCAGFVSRNNLNVSGQQPLRGGSRMTEVFSGENFFNNSGNASSTFDGAIYFPTTSVRYVGNSSGSGYTFLIADTITVTGNSSMQVGDNYSTLANGSPVKSSTLYE